MTAPLVRKVASRGSKLLAGAFVVVLAVPTGAGPGIGGWIAGNGTTSPSRGTVAGGVAGLLGALPWSVLAYLASAGAVPPIGYHDGFVHVGVNPAPPGLLSPWQEVAVAILLGGIVTTVAAVGGLVAGMRTDFAGELRAELATFG